MSQQRETATLVAGGPADQPAVLASDADRDAAAGILSSAFAEGRLTADEHSERVRAAYGARTQDDLAGLTADLPGSAGDVARQQAVLVSDGVDRCLLCALLILCPPAGIAWLLAARRRPHLGPGPGQRLAPIPAVGTATAVRGSDR
jgi:hypothetical protein